MKKRNTALPMLLAVVLGAAGLVLRVLQRQAALGSDGLWLEGCGESWALIALSAAALVIVVVLCARLPAAASLDTLQPAGPLADIVSHLAVLVLLAGGVVQLLSNGGELEISALALVAAAVLLEGCHLARQQGKRPSLMLYALAVLCLALRLILEFRLWSKDPSIWDYCFLLLSTVSVMLACYHMGAFSIDRGQRRRTVFFCLIGVYFSLVSVMDGDWAQRLAAAGTALLLFAYGLMLLRPVQERDEPA